MNKFQDTSKMFNSEANLNNFLTNNEYMREILSSIESEKGKEKSNAVDKDKDRESDTRKEKESEKSPDKFSSTDPSLNSLYRELTSIMKVLIKKITDYQALARDCRGSSKGGVGMLTCLSIRTYSYVLRVQQTICLLSCLCVLLVRAERN